jgi:hypothetical protein
MATSGYNCFGIPSLYRGWSISQGPDDCYYGTGPNYEADWQGEEDGFVGNGEQCSGGTWDDLKDEIDTWIEEHPEDRS